MSEVVGFTLVFSLIAATVAVVYVGGLGSLQSAQQAERLTNAERAFDVLDDNLDDIVGGHAPSRATAIKLGGAGLYLGDPVVLNVTAVNNTGGTVGPYTVALRPIVYEFGPTKVVYEAGAVIRQDRAGAVMNAQPPFLFGYERTVIPFVQTRSASRGSTNIAGETTVLVRAVRANSAVLAAETDDGPYDVTFNVTTERTEVWERHLEGELTASSVKLPMGASEFCTVHGETVTCTFETERFYVAVTRIDVSLA